MQVLDINIFQYISVRAGISFFIAFVLTMYLMPKFIRWDRAKLDNEWKKIENRMQLSRENIEASNVTAAEANAQKAVAEWNSAVIQAEIDADTKATKTQIITEQLANMRKEGALMVARK